MTNRAQLLGPEDWNRLGAEVNAALKRGRTSGDEYIAKWYTGEAAIAAKEWWDAKYAFCKENGQVYVPINT